jgi:hypothetical protein
LLAQIGILERDINTDDTEGPNDKQGLWCLAIHH